MVFLRAAFPKKILKRRIPGWKDSYSTTKEQIRCNGAIDARRPEPPWLFIAKVIAKPGIDKHRSQIQDY